MKTILVVTLALLLAFSSFSQTQGTAVRATNGVAFGTLTVQGHILGTNTTETNFLAGGAVLTSGKYVGDGQGLTNLNYIERLNGKGTNINLYIAGNTPSLPTVLNVSQLQLYGSAPYVFGNSNDLGGVSIVEVQYSNAVSNNAVSFLGSLVNGYVNQSTNNLLVADQGSTIQPRLVEDNNLSLYATSGSSIRGDINNSSNVVIQATVGSQISASTAAAVNSRISAERAMVLAFPSNNYTNGVTNAFAVVSSSGVSGINKTGLFGDGSQITNLTPSGIGGPYVGVTGVAPYSVSNLWSVVLPDGATAFQLGNPGAGYAAVFATNFLVTPDGAHYAIFTQNTNTLFGGDVFVTNGVYHGKSFRPQLVAATIVGATAQSTNLMEIQGGTSNILAYVDKDGVFSGNGAGLTNLNGVSAFPQAITNNEARAGGVTIATNLTVGTINIFANGQDSTFIGRLAGASNGVPATTNAIYNTFVGSQSGQNNTTGYAETFLGYNSGQANTVGNANTFLGYQSGMVNTNGKFNVFVGVDAGFAEGGSWNNVLIGHHVGINYNPTNATGNSVMIGENAGEYTTTGTDNVFIGSQAAASNTTSESSVVIGAYAGQNCNPSQELAGNVLIGRDASFYGSGYQNTMVGYRSGYSNDTGFANTYLGYLSGWKNTTGVYNTFLGYSAGQGNLTAQESTLVGFQAGYKNNSSYTSGFGAYALFNHTGTGNNDAFGAYAGYTCPNNAYGNVFIGNSAGYYETGNNKLFIDNNYRGSEGLGRSNALIYGVFGTGPSDQTLTVNGSVGIGTLTPAAKLDVNGAIHSGVTNTTTPALVSLGTNNAVLRCPDGGSWILRVGNDGTLSTVTNSAGL